MALIVHSGNRLEDLAGVFAEVMRENPLPPLDAETIIVQSVGMRQWLSIKLAEQGGILMNARFLYPANFVEDLFGRILPKEAPSPVFRREVLSWKIHGLLPGLLDGESFAELSRYINAGEVSVQSFQLSQKIAGAFDRYLAFRPDMIRAWENGAPEGWQSELWRAVANDTGSAHPPGLAYKLAEKLKSETLLPGLLPGRVTVFAPFSLPPFYIQIIGAIAAHTEVRLFQLTPTREYWGDIRSEKEQARRRRWLVSHERSPDEAVREVGHPLLASLGRIGREFHESLLDLTPSQEPDHSREPEGDSMLVRLQSDIFKLTVPEVKHRIAPEDRSLSVHNCHSPLRELEVLRDALLASFDADHTLKPRDVIVSMPDVEAYTPFIDAVFGATEGDQMRFPYSIADRPMRVESGVADAFLRALEVIGTRFTAGQILGLLDCRAIRERFGFEEDDLPLLQKWIREVEICWGRDAEHRSEFDLPAWDQNTWRLGLDRLLLGYALPGDGRRLYEGILPCDSVEGSTAETLGRLVEFCELLFAADTIFKKEHTAEAWAEHLKKLLSTFCSDRDAFAGEWTEVAEIIEQLAVSTKIAGHTLPLAFEIIRAHCVSVLDVTDRGAAFLRGGFTFCSLKPMRSIPHRIVCLLGLNGDAFPRAGRPPGFDLTVQKREHGDRSERDDDRYLFLEAILSARDVLHLSFCGQSAKDGSEKPPSVIVEELMDVLEAHFEVEGDMRSHVVRKHRLHGFHPDYFRSGSGLFTFSQAHYEAALSAFSPRLDSPAFFQKPLARQEETVSEINLEQIVSCLTHPAKYFAREQLGIRLPFEETPFEDAEPFELGYLARYQLAQELTVSALSADEALLQYETVQAGGGIPHGYTGSAIYYKQVESAEKLAAIVAAHAPGVLSESLYLTRKISFWKVHGTIPNLRGRILVRCRNADLKAKDLLALWVELLFLCADDSAPCDGALVVAKDKTYTFSKPSEPAKLLAELIGHCFAVQNEPLPFFPETSLEYVAHRDKGEDDAQKKAWAKWEGNQFDKGQPESRDAWNAFVWRDHPEPLSERWRKLSVEILVPLLQHRGGING